MRKFFLPCPTSKAAIFVSLCERRAEVQLQFPQLHHYIRTDTLNKIVTHWFRDIHHK